MGSTVQVYIAAAAMGKQTKLASYIYYLFFRNKIFDHLTNYGK